MIKMIANLDLPRALSIIDALCSPLASLFAIDMLGPSRETTVTRDAVSDGSEAAAERYLPVDLARQDPPLHRPVVTDPKISLLPFNDLHWEDFERLLLDVAQVVDHLVEARRYGVSGQEQAGIDVVGRSRNGDWHAYQAKKVTQLRRAQARQALDTFAKGRRPLSARRLVIATACRGIRAEVSDLIHEYQTEYPNLEFDQVWDAEYLSTVLRSHPRIVGRYFGNDVACRFCDAAVPPKSKANSVLTHEEMLQGLSSRHTFLLDSELPFAGPGAEHVADPARLLARLPGSDPPGVLLVGPAGAGKTRTCFEVAARAYADGWRVLHVPASPEVTVEQLSADVLEPGHGRILLIFDHLDACSQLDLRALADRFLAEAKRSGMDVTFLASTRSGSRNELMNQRGGGLLFNLVRLRDDQTYRSQVAGHIIHSVAPTAVRELGEAAMAKTCGQRPIITLLIARTIERYLAEGRRVPDVVSSHAGQLRPWLRDALRHDQLTHTDMTRQGPLDMVEPSAQELACAVAVAACPQPREAVEAAVNELPGADFGASAVAQLLRLGWLEEVGGQLVTVHDIVTDELLLNSMLPPPNNTIHEPSARAACAALSRSGRSFALLAEHLRRVMADLSAQTERDQVADLERFCGKWLIQQRMRLGELLVSAGKDGEHALLTIVLERPWGGVVTEHWEEVGSPWLARAEARHEATSFLATVVRSKNAPTAGITAALSWLSRHYTQTDADQVIRALLGRVDLMPTQRRLVLDYAIAWVEDRPRWAATPEVLCRLLTGATTPAERMEAARCALGWLRRDRNPQGQAFRVVRLLLTLEDLPVESRDLAVSTALTWVETHDQDGASVLSVLLRARTLTEPQRHQVGLIGLRWLREHPPGPSRRPLIHALLDSDHVRECLAILWSQMRDNETDPIVIHRMLENDRISAEQARFIIGQAFNWLQTAELAVHRRLVITALMHRGDLSAEESVRLTDHVMALVDTDPDPKFLTVVLHRASSLNAEQIRRIVAMMVERCRSKRGLKPKRPLINALLQRSDLAFDEVREVVGLALGHLDVDFSLNRGDILISLLERTDLLPDEYERALSHALRWLNEDGALSNTRFPFLLIRLLRRADLPPQTAAAYEYHAREWLATVPLDDKRAYEISRNLPYRAGN
ncbi:hypothetical protein amrb99_24060 [Actinomadura sp. RB99]|uniref:hypothetical protein n=1 Tax=Actinomadura sp. RB99 TaxID=2691577 RepID=UPI001684A464|nr:hypothetical protein [Actinomadura sp. RB99]MBD2893485.1 hypothetical protein [Actinomadura sp. RB99]